MNTSLQSLGLKAAIFAALITAASANANAAGRFQQVSQPGAGAVAAVTLPEVLVRPRPDSSWYYNPYTSGHAQRPSSLNHIPYQHYKGAGRLRRRRHRAPYTSGFGPCTEGPPPRAAVGIRPATPFRHPAMSGRRSINECSGAGPVSGLTIRY